MSGFRRPLSLIVAGCSGMAICASQQAFAQESAAPAAGATAEDAADSEIIVTAQKRSERLQDVPMSITAATAEQMVSQGVTSIDKLDKLSAGFTVNKTNRGAPIFIIRGVGFSDVTTGASSGVAVYIDQLPIPFSAMTRGAVLDLERVEVLKGPQGTLFGQNSTGGAVNFIAAKPTSSLEAGFNIAVGRFNQVDAEAFVSGPISDTLSARVAVRNEYRGDWQRGYTVDQEIGERRFMNGRVILDWKPSENLTVELSASGWRDRSDSQMLQFVKYQPQNPAGTPFIPAPIATFPAAPDDARAAAWDPGFDFSQHTDMYQLGGRIDYQLSDSLNLTSLTTYADFDQNIPFDSDASVFPLTISTNTARIKTFAQELRLAGTFMDERLKWMIGGSYAKDKIRERYIQDPLLGSGGQIGPFRIRSLVIENDQEVDTQAVFGSLDFNLTENLVAQGSVRYTDQNRDFSGCTRDAGDGTTANAFAFLSSLRTGIPQTIAPGACATLSAAFLPIPIVTGSLDEENLSWRAGLNWKFDRDNLVYANVTKGYKAGTFGSVPAQNAAQIIPVKQESVLAYEVGTKLSAFSRRVQLNAAAFYYDYRDKQVLGFGQIPGFTAFSALVSVPKTRVRGAELGVTVNPFEGFSLNASGTYLDTRIQANPITPIGAFGNNPANFVGSALPLTPKWQAVLDAQYRFAVGGDLEAYVGTSAVYHSSTTGILRSDSPAVAALEQLGNIPGYTLIDLRAGLEMQDRAMRLEVWGRNITDKFYIVGVTRTSDYVTRYTGMPVTYGATLTYRFR